MSTLETTEVLARRHGAAYRWFIALTLLIGMISAVITTTIVNVAIPEIMGTFGITQDVAHWLSTGALAGTTVAMLIQAWLMKRFGPRRTFNGALIVFGASLLVAGLAPNELVLILARVVQGAIAGMLQPMCIYLLFRVFPADRKGQAMGLFGLVTLLGPALGPFLGGLMIEHFNWRYIFFIAVPPSCVALLLGSVFLPQWESDEDEAQPRQAFDWLALALVSLSLGSLLLALSTGQREGWTSDRIVATAAVAASSGVAFIWRELRVPAPLVNLRTLANPVFAAAAVLSGIFGIGLFSSIYLLPLFVQTIQGFTALEAGLLLMPGGLVLTATLPVAGYLADRVSPRSLVVAGIAFSIASSFWMAGVDVNTPFLALAVWAAAARVGIGLINPVLNVTALQALRPDQLGQGAGLVNFFRQLGGAFGVSLVSMTLDIRMAARADAINPVPSAATADFLRQVQGMLARAGASADLQVQGALQYLSDAAAAQASTLAFRDSFFVVGVLFVIALVPGWLIGPGVQRRHGAGVPSAVTEAS